MGNGVLIVIPTYNERENLPPLLQSIWTHLADAHVLVVDDWSPDGTGEWCQTMAAEDNRLHCLQRAEKQGIGAATLAGLRWGLERDYRWLVTMDGDGSHAPGDMTGVVAELESGSADVWVGSRYGFGGSIEQWPAHRRWASRLVNRLSRVFLRVPVSDYTSAYRLYRSAALAELNLDRIHSSGYAYLEELLFKLHQRGATIREFPIRFRNRDRGQSKASWRHALRAATDLTRLIALRR